MKKQFILATLFMTTLAFAQGVSGNVGVNTTEPKTTMDINATAAQSAATSNVPVGMLIPRVSKAKAQAMGANSTGSTLIYIDDVSTGSGNYVDFAVNQIGYYYFRVDATNGNRWIRLHDTYTPGFNTMLNGTNTPAANVGNMGDFFMDPVNQLLWGPKTAAGWGTPVVIKGKTGEAGPVGSGAGANFDIPIKAYTCDATTLGRILRSVEGYFECKHYSTSPSVTYGWFYTGVMYPSYAGINRLPVQATNYAVTYYINYDKAYPITTLSSPGAVTISQVQGDSYNAVKVLIQLP